MKYRGRRRNCRCPEHWRSNNCDPISRALVESPDYCTQNSLDRPLEAVALLTLCLGLCYIIPSRQTVFSWFIDFDGARPSRVTSITTKSEKLISSYFYQYFYCDCRWSDGVYEIGDEILRDIEILRELPNCPLGSVAIIETIPVLRIDI